MGTKFRQPLITPNHEIKIYDHIQSELEKLECYVKKINGIPDHIHALFRQSPKYALSDIIKQIKGNTSHWINSSDMIDSKFAWQGGYGGFSVSESQVEIVAAYIENQKHHHKKLSFKEEYEAFLKSHGFDIEGIWDEE